MNFLRAFTRSSFAFATFLFVVLFAPQVGVEHHVDRAQGTRLISTFPDGFTLLVAAFVLWLAVRYAVRGGDEQAFARGVARGSAVSVIGALLNAIAIAVLGSQLFDTPGFAAFTAVSSFLVVSIGGSALSALFARWLTRGRTAAPPRHA